MKNERYFFVLKHSEDWRKQSWQELKQKEVDNAAFFITIAPLTVQLTPIVEHNA